MEDYALYYGNNLGILYRHIPDEGIDLGKQYPKTQLLAVADLLSGKKIDMPLSSRSARRSRKRSNWR